jgi:hypothetical protein
LWNIANDISLESYQNDYLNFLMFNETVSFSFKRRNELS